MPIVFASITPHPPIILPFVGSERDRNKVKKTIENLSFLGNELKKTKPDSIIISSPHPDWGFNVPLFFLAKNFQKEIKTYLILEQNPKFYFKKGKELAEKIFSRNLNYALISSGDLSHCLKQGGPYGFHPDGPKFDKELIECLNKKDIERILELDKLYPEAAECGLRSFCFILGILEALKINYQPEILSYEFPFGVGYLVSNFKINIS